MYAHVASPRLDFERSLALHRAVADKLRADPSILDRARRKLAEWLGHGGRSAPLWRRWQDVLQGTPDEVTAYLVDRSLDPVVDHFMSIAVFQGQLPAGHLQSPQNRLLRFAAPVA